VPAKQLAQIPVSFLVLRTDPSLRTKTFQLAAGKKKRKTVKFLEIRRHITLGKRPLPK
jgi:hypothetical protein